VAEEQHNYVGENSVHFHRQEPAGVNLEFRRSVVQKADIIQSDKSALGPNLRANRLRSKLNKKTLSTKEAEKGAEREEEGRTVDVNMQQARKCMIFSCGLPK
jgi:hypothetical protein